MAEDFVFDADEEELQESVLNLVSKPDIAKMKFVGYKIHTAVDKAKKSWDVIDLDFKILSGFNNGADFQYRFFKPTDAKKAKNLFIRLHYILSYLWPNGRTEENQAKIKAKLKATTWDELRQNTEKILKTLQKNDKAKKHMHREIYGKLVAWVTNKGKPVYPTFTNYIGFFAEVDEQESDNPKLTFGRKEVKSNAEFLHALESGDSPDDDPDDDDDFGLGGSDDSSDDDFESQDLSDDDDDFDEDDF